MYHHTSNLLCYLRNGIEVVGYASKQLVRVRVRVKNSSNFNTTNFCVINNEIVVTIHSSQQRQYNRYVVVHIIILILIRGDGL